MQTRTNIVGGALIMACSVLAWAQGCGDGGKDAVTTKTVEAVKAPEIKAPGSEQQKRFVDAMMATAQRGDPRSFNDLIDWSALARRGARNLRLQPEILEGVAKGARDGCAATGVCAALAAAGHGRAKVTYLGPVKIGNEQWLSFRRLPQEGGFDHVSFLLAVDGQGVARAVDVLQLSLGETASSTLRRALLPMVMSDDVRRMQGTESLLAKHGAEITNAQSLATAGKPTEALAVLSNLPATLRSDPFVMAQRVTITRMTGDEQAYLLAIDELAQRHPKDPIAIFSQLDAYALRQRYTDALHVVDLMQSMVAPDPYLDVLRANLYASAGMGGDAVAAAQRAIGREPDLIEAHFALVAATLKQQDYAATTRALLTIRKQLGVMPQLEGVADYAGYLASPAYADLKATLGP